MRLLFVDESGDHNLEIIDSQYPIFVLAGAIFNFDYYSKLAKQKISKTKKYLFGDKKIIFHTADIYRNRNGFEKLKDKVFREKFYESINKLVESLDFEIVAAAVLKKEHSDQYGIMALDPYLLSLEFLIERFIFSLDSYNEKGIVIAESRGQQLDNQLDLAWLNVKINGTRFVEPTRVKEKIKDFQIIPKSKAVGGLEIADLIASPIGRALLKKETKEDFKVIKKKFRRSKSGKILGHGLVIFPKCKTGPATQSPLI